MLCSPPSQVQYPSALNTMVRDLQNLRAVAYYLSKVDRGQSQKDKAGRKGLTSGVISTEH